MASGGDLEEQFSVLSSQFSVKSGGLPGATWKPFVEHGRDARATQANATPASATQASATQANATQASATQANATAPDGIFCFLS